jgi:hypothetical protein
MLNYYLRINPSPLIKQNELNFEELYKLDRTYAIEKEKLKGRELDLYDKSINLDKRKYLEKKVYLIKLIIELFTEYKKIDNFKFNFNEYNGYYIKYEDFEFTTYNYLGDEYIKEIINKII